MKATDIWRALTLRQPWADLVMAGVKDVENRTWRPPSTLPCQCQDLFCDHPGAPGHTPYPFRLWIHAGQQVDLREGNRAIMDWCEAVNAETRRHERGPLLSPIKMMERFQDPDRRGVLLGSVTVTGCHPAEDCYATGHWVGGCTCAGVGLGVGIQHEPGCGLEPYCSDWAHPQGWHWTLTDPVPLPEPVPMRGRQGLWNLPADLDLTP